MPDVGLRIKEIRQKQNITQTELAKKINVNRATISQYESGKVKNIPEDKLSKIAEILNIPVLNLLGYDKKTVDLGNPNLSMLMNGHKLSPNQMNKVRKTAIDCTDKKLKVDLDKTDYEFVYKGREISKSDWKFVQKILENLTK